MKTEIAIMQYFIDETYRIYEVGRVSARTRSAEELRVWLVEKYEDDICDVRTCVRLSPPKFREAAKHKEPLKLLQ